MPKPPHSTVANIGEIVARGSLTVLFAALSACSGATPAEQYVIPWNPGQYNFDGVISSSPTGMRTERRLISGHVVVGPNGPTSMESTDGACGAPEPRFVRQDEALGTLSFLCGDAHFTFLRRNIDIGVNMTVDVHDTTREQGCDYEVVDNRMVCRRVNVMDTQLVSRSVSISNVRRVQR